MIKQKKGVSVIIGYVLLIAFAIMTSIFVYSWLKTYAQESSLECQEGVSLMIESYEQINNQLNLTIKNNGRFDVAGYFIRASTDPSKNIATIDLSSKIISGGQRVQDSIRFSSTNENLFLTNEEKTSLFDLSELEVVYLIEIVPIRFQNEEGRIKLISCGDEKAREKTFVSSGGGGGCTPDCSGVIDSFTKLLLHMDDTGLTDETGKTITLNGGVARSATQYKFPVVSGYSAYFDGDGDYLSLDDSLDWDFDGDFTIDAWIYTATTQGTIVSHGSRGTSADVEGWAFEVDPNYLSFYGQYTANIYQESWSPSLNTWYHVAAVRESGTMHLYVNGSELGAGGTVTILDGVKDLIVGAGWENGYIPFKGYIDELRISKGIARWTSDFSADLPPAPYPLDKQCGSDGFGCSCGSCGNCIENYCY